MRFLNKAKQTRSRMRRRNTIFHIAFETDVKSLMIFRVPEGFITTLFWGTASDHCFLPCCPGVEKKVRAESRNAIPMMVKVVIYSS